MEKLVSEFAAQFANRSIRSLVKQFNAQVGNNGWTSARAAHDIALINKMIEKGIDVSAVADDEGISFAHHVALEDNKLVIID